MTIMLVAKVQVQRYPIDNSYIHVHSNILQLLTGKHLQVLANSFAMFSSLLFIATELTTKKVHIIIIIIIIIMLINKNTN